MRRRRHAAESRTSGVPMSWFDCPGFCLGIRPMSVLLRHREHTRASRHRTRLVEGDAVLADVVADRNVRRIRRASVGSSSPPVRSVPSWDGTFRSMDTVDPFWSLSLSAASVLAHPRRRREEDRCQSCRFQFHSVLLLCSTSGYSARMRSLRLSDMNQDPPDEPGRERPTSTRTEASDEPTDPVSVRHSSILPS